MRSGRPCNRCGCSPCRGYDCTATPYQFAECYENGEYYFYDDFTSTSAPSGYSTNTFGRSSGKGLVASSGSSEASVTFPTFKNANNLIDCFTYHSHVSFEFPDPPTPISYTGDYVSNNAVGYGNMSLNTFFNSYMTTGSMIQHSIVQFSGMGIPQGTTIDSATLSIQAVNTTMDDGYMKIYGEDEDNATDLATGVGTSFFTGLTKTTNTTDFNLTSILAMDYYEIDVTNIVQEILDRGGWSDNNKMNFLIETQTTNDFSYLWNKNTSTPSMSIVTSSGVVGYGSLNLVNTDLNVKVYQDGDIWLTLPNASGVQIGQNFQSGDAIAIDLQQYIVPPNYQIQLYCIKFMSKREETLAGIGTAGTPYCEQIRMTGAYDIYDVGTLYGFANTDLIEGEIPPSEASLRCFADYYQIDINPEECPITTICPLIGRKLNTYDGHTIYGLESSQKTQVVVNGSGWKIDDFCVTHYIGKRSFGFCDQNIDPVYWTDAYDVNLDDNGNLLAGSDPVSYSGKTVELTFATYADEYFDVQSEDTNPSGFGNLRCQPIDRVWTSGDVTYIKSIFSYIQVPVKEYSIDLLASGSLMFMQYNSIQEDLLLYGGGNLYYHGYHCGDYYSEPCGNVNNPQQYTNVRSLVPTIKGNVTFVGNSGNPYRQLGVPDSVNSWLNNDGSPLVTSTNDFSLNPIPRIDMSYTVERMYNDGGGIGWWDLGVQGPLWEVEYRAFYLEWNSINRYWEGDFQFLGASGASGHSLSTPSAYGEDYDFGILFPSGDPPIKDMYLQGPCGENFVYNINADTYYRDNLNCYLYDASGLYSLSKSALFQAAWAGYANHNSPANVTQSSLLLAGSYAQPFGAGVAPNYIVGGSTHQFIYRKDITNLCTPDTSGSYFLSANGMWGHDLDVGTISNSGITSSVLPFCFVDWCGYPITRSYSRPVLVGALPVGYMDRITVTDNNQRTLPTISNVFNIFEYDGTVRYDPYSDPKLIEMYPLRSSRTYNTLPVWCGSVICEFFYDDSSPIGSESFDYEDVSFLFVAQASRPTNYGDLCLFVNADNNELMAFISFSHIVGMSKLFPSCGNPPTSVLGAGFYTSERDVVDGTYFARVNVLNDNPLKLEIIQQFRGAYREEVLPCDWTDGIESCYNTVFFPCYARTIIQAPHIGTT